MADRFHLDQWLLRALDDEALSSLGGSEVYNWLLMSSTGILWKVIETSSLNRASESVIGKKHTISILIESVLWKQDCFFLILGKNYCLSFPYPILRIFFLWSEKRIANCIIPIPSNVFWYVALCFVKITKAKLDLLHSESFWVNDFPVQWKTTVFLLLNRWK